MRIWQRCFRTSKLIAFDDKRQMPRGNSARHFSFSSNCVTRGLGGRSCRVEHRESCVRSVHRKMNQSVKFVGCSTARKCACIHFLCECSSSPRTRTDDAMRRFCVVHLPTTDLPASPPSEFCDETRRCGTYVRDASGRTATSIAEPPSPASFAVRLHLRSISRT